MPAFASMLRLPWVLELLAEMLELLGVELAVVELVEAKLVGIEPVGVELVAVELVEVAVLVSEDALWLDDTAVATLVAVCEAFALLSELVILMTELVSRTILFAVFVVIGSVELDLAEGLGVDVATWDDVTTTVDTTVVVLLASLKSVDVIVENCVDMESTSEIMVLVSKITLLCVIQTK
jgi:hypothetical protein